MTPITISRWEGPKVTLQEAQAIVGGYVERIVLVHNRIIMLVDDDGLSKRLPINRIATAVRAKWGWDMLITMPNHFSYTVVGNALILSGDAAKGWR